MPLFESISLKLLCTSTKCNDSGHSKVLGKLAAVQNRRSLLSKYNYNTNVNGWINEVIYIIYMHQIITACIHGCNGVSL